MKVVEMVQNSKEWEELRKGKIGASDANIILGLSDFCTPRELFLMKKGLLVKEDDSTFIQDKGHRLETKARAMFELETMLDFPPVCVIHSEYSWLMASLDGYNEEVNETFECKFVGQEDFEMVKNGHMLPWYMPQVQTQLIVAGARVCNFVVIADDKDAKENGDFPYKKAVLRVEYDPKYSSEILMPALFSFQDNLELNIEPPISSKDTLTDDSEDLLALIEDYKVKKQSAEEWKKLEDSAKKKIFAKVKHNRVICHGHKITETLSESKMVVDYESVVKDLKIQIDPKYTSMSEPRKTQRITFFEKKEEAVEEKKEKKEKVKKEPKKKLTDKK